MNQEEAERIYKENKTNAALGWALEQLRNAKKETKVETSDVNLWKNRATMAHAALEAMYMQVEYIHLTSRKRSSRLERLTQYADSLRGKKITWMKPTELVKVLNYRMNGVKIIGGISIPDRQVMQFIRGDFRKIEMRWKDFSPTEDGIEPDFSRLNILNEGDLISLGDYVIPTETILDKHEDVHTRHCCALHGCKYGNDNCSVTSGHKPQSYPCESCDEDLYGG